MGRHPPIAGLAVDNGVDPYARERGLYLKFSGAQPYWIDGDAVKIWRVAQNLVINAIKCTSSGGITVAWQDCGPDDADRWAIHVQDTGPGVPPEERYAFFQSFFRGRAPAGARVEGTGLGLAIAREFAEAHGGRISVVTRANGGHFRIILPRKSRRPMAEAA